MRPPRRPSRSELVAAALTLAVAATVIGIGVHVYLLTSELGPTWPPVFLSQKIGYARPLVLFLLTVIVILRRSRVLSIVLLLAALTQIPYMGNRCCDGAADVSEIMKIRFGELTHTSAVLFDLSAGLFLISASILLSTTLSRRA